MRAASTVASDEATAASDGPGWKCPYGCEIRFPHAAPGQLEQHLNTVHANEPERETWLRKLDGLVARYARQADPDEWMRMASEPGDSPPEHDATADTQPPPPDTPPPASSTTPTTRKEILAGIGANLHEREAGQRARAALPGLLARGRRIPGLTITEMARAARISRQTAHELVRQAGDVD
jgi:hypothetical protein